jgi:hypothetical protein
VHKAGDYTPDGQAAAEMGQALRAVNLGLSAMEHRKGWGMPGRAEITLRRLCGADGVCSSATTICVSLERLPRAGENETQIPGLSYHECFEGAAGMTARQLADIVLADIAARSPGVGGRVSRQGNPARNGVPQEVTLEFDDIDLADLYYLKAYGAPTWAVESGVLVFTPRPHGGGWTPPRGRAPAPGWPVPGWSEPPRTPGNLPWKSPPPGVLSIAPPPPPDGPPHGRALHEQAGAASQNAPADEVTVLRISRGGGAWEGALYFDAVESAGYPSLPVLIDVRIAREDSAEDVAFRLALKLRQNGLGATCDGTQVLISSGSGGTLQAWSVRAALRALDGDGAALHVVTGVLSSQLARWGTVDDATMSAHRPPWMRPEPSRQCELSHGVPSVTYSPSSRLRVPGDTSVVVGTPALPYSPDSGSFSADAGMGTTPGGPISADAAHAEDLARHAVPDERVTARTPKREA